MSSRWACLILVLGSLPFFFVNCSDGFKASHVIALVGCCSEDSRLLWGPYEVPTSGQQTLEEFEAMIGKRPPLVGNNAWWLDKYDWSGFTNLYANPTSGNPENNWANKVASRGAIPVMLWNAYDPDGIDCSSGQPYFDNLLKYRASNIASGHFDAYIRKWARDIKAFQRPIWIRTMHELNAKRLLTTAQPCLYATSWDAGLEINGTRINTEQDVILAWRHIVNLFREEGATNVQWVWSVLAWESKPFGGTNDIELTNIYPGDDFVDWIGIECYNFASDAEWKSCSDRAQGIYAEASALSATKPLMLAEMGAYEHARKADWMSETFDPLDANSVIQRLPRVRALMYWNDNRNDFGQLWINSSSASVTSFRNAIHSPLYYSPMQ